MPVLAAKSDIEYRNSQVRRIWGGDKRPETHDRKIDAGELANKRNVLAPQLRIFHDLLPQ